MSTCDFNLVAPVTRTPELQSSLHRKLRENFPESVDKTGNSSHYIHIRTSAAFIKAFGTIEDREYNWLKTKDYDVLKNLTENAGVFNDQGEPQLHQDSVGPYILTPTGDVYYLLEDSAGLTADEYANGINTLTGAYLNTNSNVEVSTYVQSFLEARILTLNKEIERDNKLIPLVEGKAKHKVFMSVLAKTEAADKIQNILNSGSVLNAFVKRINLRIESQSIKVTQTIGDKEDDGFDSHEDTINFSKESNESSNRALDDIEIIKFLSSIPIYQKYEKNFADQKTLENTLFGGELYMAPAAVRSLVEAMLADMIVNAPGENPFQSYLNEIKSQLVFSEHPELHHIYQFLNNLGANVDNIADFKVKFYAAMDKATNSFAITIVQSEKDKITLNVIDPALVNNKLGKITNGFIERVINTENRDRETISLIKGKATKAFKAVRNSEDTQIYKEFLHELLVNQLNIKLNPATINRLVEHQFVTGKFEGLNSLISQFLTDDIRNEKMTSLAFPNELTGELDIIKELMEDRKNSQDYKDFLLRPNTFFRTLARYEAIYQVKNSDASVFVGSVQRWLYSFKSSLQIELAKMKRGLSTRLDELQDRGLYVVNYMLDNPKEIDNIKLITNTELKTKNDPNPTLHKQITAVDLHLDIFIKMFNSQDSFHADNTAQKQGKGSQREKDLISLKNYLIYNFGADKNSLFALTGLPAPNYKNSDLYNIGKKELGEDFKRIIRGYVSGEVRRSIKDSQVVIEYMEKPNRAFLMENLIPDYHYKIELDSDGNPMKDIEVDELTAEDFKRGNYHKIGLFSDSLDEFVKDNYTLVYGVDEKADVAPVIANIFEASKNGPNSDFNRLMAVVFEDLNTIIQKNYETLNSMTLINTENSAGEIVNKKLFDITTNIDFQGNQDLALFSYITSSFLVGYELSNLFNGHISYYKQKDGRINLDDFLKRAPAVASNGRYMYTNRKDLTTKMYTTYEGVEKHVIANTNTVVAVINDIKSGVSEFSKLISAGLGINTHYKNDEVGDGQGIVTDRHFKEIVDRVYGWKAEDDVMYKELSDPNHVITRANIKWLKRGANAFTPLKLTHYQITEDGLPIFFKYSVAPLFPAMIKNSQMERLYKQMNKQGVDQVVFKSGSKASNPAQTTIHTTNGDHFTGIKETFTLNPFVIDSEQLKVQTEVPTKLNNSIAVGNQLIKNMLANLDIDSDTKNYLFQGEHLTGKEIYNEIETSIKNILQQQLTLTLGELGFDKKELKFNKVNIKKFLKNQMDIETESDILNLLDTNLPIETIPNFTQRAFPVISKFVHKNAGKIYTNGSSVVQVANIGFDKITDKQKDGIFFLDNDKKDLTPPVPKTYKDLTREDKKLITADPDDIIYWDEDNNMSTVSTKTNKMRINKARILMPFSQLFAGTDISYNEFKEMYKNGKVDPRIFTNAIGYRIPNQSMASIDSFEIVGILPPIAGDQAVVYNEITTKTGSDFDIDKMYMMLPTWKTKGERVVVPDENLPLLKALEKAFKRKMVRMTDFHTIESLKTMSGNGIVKMLWRNDSELKEELLKVLPTLEKGMDGPIKFLAENYDIIMSVLQKNGTTVRDTDGSLLLLSNVAKSTLSAHQKAWEANEPIEAEKKIKMREIKEKFGWKKPETFEYEIPDNRFLKNSKNRLIELYASILESETSYDDLMSPLDSPKIKNAINQALYDKAIAMGRTKTESVKEFMTEIKSSGLEQMFPVDLVDARVNVLEAKSLIAIMANNMTDLGESQKVGFALKYDIGFNTKDLSRIFQLGKQGKNDAKISKNISYVMNAAVDAAKDAYIIDGNFTTVTANTAIMLMRMGLSEKEIFTILTNETIMNVSRDKKAATAKTSNINSDYNNETLEEFATSVIGRLTEDKTIFDIVSIEDFQADTESAKEDILGYWYMLQEVGKEFNNSVVAMKSDSNGPGKNLPTMVGLDNRIDRMLEDSVLNGGEKWFRGGITAQNRKFNPDITSNPDMKVLGAFANNTLFLMKEISAQMFLEATPKVISAINSMSGSLGNPLPTDEGSIKLLYNYLYPLLLYKTGHPLYQMKKTHGALTEAEWLIQEFPAELQKKRMATGNHFLNQLIVDTKGKENLIRFINSENHAPEEKLRFKESLVELMNEDLGFMDNLVKYSYLTTGFKATPFSFHQFFPANYFINNFHGKYVQDFINDTYGVIDSSQALSLIAINNFQNYKIVRKQPAGTMMISTMPVTDEKILKKARIPNPYGEPSFVPFLKKETKGKVLLYNLTDITDGVPTYEKNRELNEISTFKTYNYNFTPGSLYTTNVYYHSKVAQLFKDSNAGTTHVNRGEFNGVIEEIDRIFAGSGQSIRELGLTQKEWNSLEDEAQEIIIKCN